MAIPLQKHGRFFDLWSRFYRLTPLGLALRRVQRVAVSRLGIRPAERVLDLGCGPGDGVRHIAARGGLAFGLDYSEGMLALARGIVQRRGQLVRGEALRLPFRDGAFDKVVCSNSFHHYSDPRAALAEIRRVLRPSGLVVIVDPRRDHLGGFIAVDVVERLVFGLSDVRTHTLDGWRVLLREAGFAAADVRPGPLHRPFAHAEVFVEASR